MIVGPYHQRKVGVQSEQRCSDEEAKAPMTKIQFDDDDERISETSLKWQYAFISNVGTYISCPPLSKQTAPYDLPPACLNKRFLDFTERFSTCTAPVEYLACAFLKGTALLHRSQSLETASYTSSSPEEPNAASSHDSVCLVTD